MKTGYKKSPTKPGLEKGYIDSPMPDISPTMSLDSKDLPAISGWKVGGKYTITLEVEQTGMHKHDTIDNDNDLHATFKILNAKEAK